MTQDEIIEMAKQAGIEEAYSLKHNQYLVRFKDGSLEAFAKLVAEKTLADHAMRETQRLGQEIEQEPVAWPCLIDSADFSENTITLVMQCKDYKVSAGTHYLSTTPPQRTEPVADYIAAKDMLDEQPVPPRTWIGLEGAEAGWFCHTDFLNARKYTKKQREYICNQLLSEAQSWDIDQYTRMMHDSTKRPFIGLTDEDMYVVSEEESCSFIAGAKWSEEILKEKNT